MIIFDINGHEDLIVCPYNSANYVSDIGGLTGLFSGCSFLSTFELIFFTIVRYRKNKRERERIRMVGEGKYQRRQQLAIENLNAIGKDNGGFIDDNGRLENG